MDFITILILSLALATDSFAVAAARQMVVRSFTAKEAISMAFFFMLFHSGTILAGYFAGMGFKEMISGIDHWVAFGLLCAVGGRMIMEALRPEKRAVPMVLSLRGVLILSLAISIDTFVVGISFALLNNVSILLLAASLGVATFIFTLSGAWLGTRFGRFSNSKAGMIGGIILIGIGVKILVEHLTR